MKTTIEQKHILLERFKNKCAYCDVKLFVSCENKGRRITVDHFVPKAKGGSDNENNLVASCRKCNEAKADMLPQDFVRGKERYDAIMFTLYTGKVPPQHLVDKWFVEPNTGFAKADIGKAPMAHLGDLAKALATVSHIAEYGAVKYGRGNWRQCDNLERYRNALARHLFAYLAGEWADADHGHAHLGAVAWNAMALLELETKESTNA